MAAVMLALGCAVPGGAALAASANGRFGPPRRFDRAWLVAEAQRRAQRPMVARLATHAVPDFDSHVRLSYGAAETLPGGLRLFPARRDVATNMVAIHVLDSGMAREIVDTHGLFGGGESADVAGFRVMNADGASDWLAFLGAAYFRASGPRGQYGLSARAVAVDTGMPEPEEFPAFTDFWIEAKGGDRLIIHALVDGPSLTGAFTLDTRREGLAMTQAVEGTLFLRKAVRRLGIAPITSMFDFGEGHRGDRADWRPEVHDSDGLAIQTGSGERIWRPLDNPPSPRVHMLRADHLKGFGMIQRDQAFDHYQDDYSFYDRRPSLWVEPVGDWGAGAIMLYEMNGASETVDNMAAMWIADAPARAGQRRDFAYRLVWTSRDPSADANAHCVDVFEGPGGVPGADPIAGATRYVFQFRGGGLAELDRRSGIEAVTDLPPASVLLNKAEPVGGQPGLWRVTLDVRTEGLKQSEFRLFLRRGQDAFSETVIKTVRP
ncbi:glucan biosynthesis protein [Novosphingobium nitrogenifigens]|uniref:glucan biosynthesis protein n=1 Tax=Novosphingobium nitrogenifigens TaxID=378548 RepID=UPI000379D76B|nr:glucan biosynthesis protein [Novosphingobium nitrogenifigens]